MYRIRFIFLFLIILHLPGFSQIQRIAEELWITQRKVVESEVSTPDTASISDSMKIAALTEQIQFYKLFVTRIRTLKNEIITVPN